MPAPTGERELAPRQEDLRGRSVLLFDNGKLQSEYGPYRAIFDAVSNEVTDRFADVEIREHRDDLLIGGAERLEEIADQVAAQRVAGVVIALGDWGVSQPSTMLAAALERRGVPAVVVAMDIGFRMALATAVLLAPGLPLVRIHSLRDATYEQMLDEARRVAPDVVIGLTASPEELLSRFQAHGPEAPPTAVPGGVLTIAGADPSSEFTALMAESGLGDGLPLVPPTEERVQDLLDAMSVDADHEVWSPVAPRAEAVHAREIATLAAMAGVRPRWAPVVLAAYEAMADPRFRLFQAAITTHPGGTFVLVSGPTAGELGFAAGRGCLGPGFAANATTGRAVALGYSFLLGARPGSSDLTAQGSPAEFTYCCAENLAESPWDGIHADEGFPDRTTVTVVKAEGPHNMIDQQSTDPARLLQTFGDSMATLGANSAYVSGCQTLLLLNPEHAALLAAAGWTKSDVQHALYDLARNPREALRGRGIVPIWPQWFDTATQVPVVEDPTELLVAVVGGGGPASQVVVPWGYSRAITRPILQQR